jgi:hypothetical protein
MTFWDNPEFGLYDVALIHRGLVFEVVTQSTTPRAIATADRCSGKGQSDTAGAGLPASKAPVLCCKIRRRRAAPGSNRIRSDLPGNRCQGRTTASQATVGPRSSCSPIAGEPAALIEYKHFRARPNNPSAAAFTAPWRSADRAVIPFLVARYWPQPWAFRVYPINDLAREHFGDP